MFRIDPQKIFGKGDGRIWELLPAAMPGLVGSTPVDVAAGDALVATLANRGAKGGRTGVGTGDRSSCLEAGLWLLAGDLGRCHALCQEVGTAYGAAWHAMMHRREGDFWNSKYWWRRAGDEGARGGRWWRALAGELQRILAGAPGRVRAEVESLGGDYDPAAFVDLVELRQGDAEARATLLDVQRWEWASLFVATWESG
jgi:hypothetical protein